MTDEAKTPDAAEGTSSEAGKGKKTRQDYTVRGNIATMKFNDMGEGRLAAALSIVVENQYKKGDEWVKGKPSYYPVNITNQAQVARLKAASEREDNALRPGSQISVEGFLNNRSAEVKGEKRYFTEIVPRAGESAVKFDFGTKENGKSDYKHETTASVAMIVKEDGVKISSSDRGEFVAIRGWTDRSKKAEDKWESEFTEHSMFSDSPAIVAKAKALKESGELAKGALIEVSGSWDRNERDGKTYNSVRVRGGEANFKLVEPAKVAEAAKQQEEPAKPAGGKKRAAAAKPADGAEKPKSKGKQRDDIPF